MCWQTQSFKEDESKILSPKCIWQYSSTTTQNSLPHKEREEQTKERLGYWGSWQKCSLSHLQPLTSSGPSWPRTPLYLTLVMSHLKSVFSFWPLTAGSAIRENFVTQGIVKHWARLPKAVVESPALGGFRRCVTVPLGTEVGGALAVLREWLSSMISKLSSNLNNSVILNGIFWHLFAFTIIKISSFTLSVEK